MTLKLTLDVPLKPSAERPVTLRSGVMLALFLCRVSFVISLQSWPLLSEVLVLVGLTSEQ
jgi:hypothetical protein